MPRSKIKTPTRPYEESVAIICRCSLYNSGRMFRAADARSVLRVTSNPSHILRRMADDGYLTMSEARDGTIEYSRKREMPLLRIRGEDGGKTNAEIGIDEVRIGQYFPPASGPLVCGEDYGEREFQRRLSGIVFP